MLTGRLSSRDLRTWVGASFLALSSALLLVLAFPRFDLDPLAWIALVPLLLAVSGRGPAASFALASLTGVVFFRGLFYWVNSDQGVTWGDAAVLNVYLGGYIGLFGLAVSLVARRTRVPLLLSAPAFWVTLEYLRSSAGFLALPWGLLGHSQHRHLTLIQVSSITGVYGLSFLIVMVNALVTEVIVRRPPRPRLALHALVILLLLGASLAFSLAALSRDAPTGQVAITLVQGNIPQRERWASHLRRQHLEKHLRLTRRATASATTALVAWPETSVAGGLTGDPVALNALSTLARETRAHLLVGSAIQPKFRPAEIRKTSLTNSAFLLSPSGALVGRYDKLHLLPFGEYLPYGDVIPWPARLVATTPRFVPGHDYTLFDLDGVRFGVLICWETIFPSLARTLVRRGATFLVNITNEAWFGDTAAPYQALAISVFRAVENRVAIARATNTGVSALIDPHGRIVGRITDGARDTFVAGTFSGYAPLRRGETFYTRYGDAFAALSIAAAVLLLGASARGHQSGSSGSREQRMARSRALVRISVIVIAQIARS